MQLSEKLSSRRARLGVIGLGYVGLPLSMEMAEAGFHVVGLDADPRKVEEIEARRSYIADVPTEVLGRAVDSGHFAATTDSSVLATVDAVSICVPTPLSKTKDPDVSYIRDAVDRIRQHLRPGQLIVLESTTYPGTTDELVRPELERTGLRVGRDFFLAFSPERIDPGNKTHGTRNTPKVVGGITPRCTELATELYSQFIDHVHPVSSARAAEMVKLLENTFRSVNIGLVNEIAQMCDVLGIDVYEVVDAAATKPFGFMPFYPGPGLGGHCIPIDPHYLAWKMKAHDFPARFIGLASEVNQEMPHLVVDKVAAGLNYQGKPVKGSRILALGVAYKRDVSDMRESPAIEIIHQLAGRGARVKYHDPFVPELLLESGSHASVPLSEENLRWADCLVILTDHTCFDIAFVVEHSRLVVDTRNSTRDLKEQYGERILKIGAPAPFAFRVAPGEAARGRAASGEKAGSTAREGEGGDGRGPGGRVAGDAPGGYRCAGAERFRFAANRCRRAVGSGPCDAAAGRRELRPTSRRRRRAARARGRPAGHRPRDPGGRRGGVRRRERQGRGRDRACRARGEGRRARARSR